MNEVLDRFRDVARGCEADVFWTPRRSPQQAMRDLAQAAEELGIEQWDVYAERGAVARLEQEVAELLGKPAAAMFPSGIMAQQAALRVHCDRAGSLASGSRSARTCCSTRTTVRGCCTGSASSTCRPAARCPTVEDLERLGTEGGGPRRRPPRAAVARRRLPAARLGRPHRPSTARARGLGVAVHVDGARIWESQPFYDRPLDEIAGVADSLYVSFYKGLGGLAGACLAGDEDVVAETRRWRKRMGGTLFHLTPYAVLALAGLREHLPRMGEYVAWGRALAGHLVTAGVRVSPTRRTPTRSSCWPKVTPTRSTSGPSPSWSAPGSSRAAPGDPPRCRGPRPARSRCTPPRCRAIPRGGPVVERDRRGLRGIASRIRGRGSRLRRRRDPRAGRRSAKSRRLRTSVPSACGGDPAPRQPPPLPRDWRPGRRPVDGGDRSRRDAYSWLGASSTPSSLPVRCPSTGPWRHTNMGTSSGSGTTKSTSKVRRGPPCGKGCGQ